MLSYIQFLDTYMCTTVDVMRPCSGMAVLRRHINCRHYYYYYARPVRLESALGEIRSRQYWNSMICRLGNSWGLSKAVSCIQSLYLL